MTFQQFQKSWWSWLMFVAIALVIGFVRHWDTLSLWCAGVLVVTGTIRLFSKQLKELGVRGMARSLAMLPPEERAQKLQQLPPDQREQVSRELEKIVV